MTFALFNPCSPCCECNISVGASTGTGGSGIPGVTITVRDIKGSGVGSCITTAESGCLVAIKSPGTYFVHNDFCNTTQQVEILKCGNSVNILIGTNSSSPIAASECFFDVPLTKFILTGPNFSQTAYGSGNILVGSIQFPQLAAMGSFNGPMPSGTYTLTVSDVEDNHYSATLSSGFPCNHVNFNPVGNPFFPNIPAVTLRKKWGYECAPQANIDGCPAPGIVVSDSYGHSATTDADGHINEKWKFLYPEFGPDPENYIKAEKGIYLPANCGNPEGCQDLSLGKCAPEPEDCSAGSFLGTFSLRTPEGYWGAPTDECLELQPELLTLTANGFVFRISQCTSASGSISSSIVNSVSVYKDSIYNSFPYNYSWPRNQDTEPFDCGNSVNVGVSPGCRKDAASTALILAHIQNTLLPFNDPTLGTIYIDNGPFPRAGFTSLQVTGTTACPTLVTFVEYNAAGDPTGRSVTVSG